jgi:formylglycine-generating enzyme required for sulfatase activity
MGYIVPRDAPNPHRDQTGFLSKAMDMQQIEVYARRIQAKHALFLFDSCFSGAIFGMTRDAPAHISDKTAKPVRQFITAGSKDQPVPDVSVFRQQFVAALQGEADVDRDGYVSGTELGEFLHRKVVHYTRNAQTPQYGKLRDALLDQGDFVFPLRQPEPAPPKPAPSPVIPPGPDPAAAMFVVVQDSEDPVELEEFLKHFGDSPYAPTVRTRLRRLQRLPDVSPPAPTPPAPAPLVLAQADIRQAQAWLQVAGLNPGPADGVWGRRTETAVRQFQAQQGLPQTGQLDAATQNKLQEEWQRLAEAQRRLEEQRRMEAERRRLAEERRQQDETRQQEEMRVAVGVYPSTLHNDIGMQFVLIPAGEFLMGSNDREADDDEKPVHRVRISRPYYLGIYEVTQAEWEAVMGQNPSRFKGRDRPVEQVSWDDVQAFIQRLNAREGHSKYRLPTEAEWEYAARAGTTTAYSFGDEARQLGAYAWYDDNAGGQTHAVGGKRPNGWSLYDMHGNVWEWVQDWYGTYPAGAVTDPQGPSSGSYRVVRGGGGLGGAGCCRSASRGNYAPGDRNGDLGFRLLRTAP